MTDFTFDIRSNRELLVSGIIHGEKNIAKTLEEYIVLFGEKITRIEVKAI